jgi:hypothetical protein
MICDPDKESRRRLLIRLEGHPLVEETFEADSVKKAIEILGDRSINAIFIDPIELGLDSASGFIFRIREKAPHIVFCLYLEFSEMERPTIQFFSDERRRFEHYYKINKEAENKSFAKDVASAVTFCISDVRVFSEVERLRLQRSFYLEALPPPDLQESIRRFYQTYPSNKKTAFIIMRFSKDKPQNKIYESVKANLKKFGILGVRADEKHFAPNLIQNVHTYLHCCTFGIAIFERIESNKYNPNVAYEVGYLYALRKPVCLLKDKSLETLHADVLGNLYFEFDTHEIKKTIKAAVRRWIASQAFGNGSGKA